MVITPPYVVSSPEPTGLRYGLFAVSGIIDLPEHAISGGITYEPVTCGFARTYETMCHTDERLASKVFDENDDWINRDSFVVYSSLVCGSAGKTQEELRTKVLRRLANGEQSQAETALNTIMATAGTALTPPGTTIADTVGELEQWLYGTGPGDQRYGNCGYLHASPRMLSYAMDAELVHPDGPMLRTRMGTYWVFGGGYQDDGRIYISGNVSVWRSPDVLVPDISQTLDRTTNQYYVVAEREYAVSYDCVAAYATYNWGIPT